MPEVIRASAKIAATKFDLNQLRDCIHTETEQLWCNFDDDIDTGYEDDSSDKLSCAIIDWYRKAASLPENGPANTQQLPSPIDIVSAYARLRKQIDVIYHATSRPIIIPWLTTTKSAGEEQHTVDPIPFILSHVVQILKFAPINYATVHEIAHGEFDRRFPSSYEGGGTEKVVCGTHTMEDLNRATLLFYQLLVRRDGKKSLVGRAPPEQKKYVFPGYADPSFKPNESEETGLDLTWNEAAETNLEFESLALHAKAEREARHLDNAERNREAFLDGKGPLVAEAADQPIQGLAAFDIHEKVVEACQSTNLAETIKAKFKARDMVEKTFMRESTEKKLIETLKALHRQIDHDAVAEKTKSQLTDMTTHLPAEVIEDFLKKQTESEGVMRFAQQNPGKVDELHEEIRKQFALEKFMSSIEPQAGFDINELTTHYKMPEYPDLRLYEDEESQALLPHQLIGKFHRVCCKILFGRESSTPPAPHHKTRR